MSDVARFRRKGFILIPVDREAGSLLIAKSADGCHRKRAETMLQTPLGPDRYAKGPRMANRPILIVTPSLEARFWRYVEKRGPDECWPWLASKTPRGYGRLMVDGFVVFASHIALTIDGRPRPAGLGGLHSCDNPPCCNARHLAWGTPRENSDDRDRKGRHKCGRGERHGSRTKPESLRRGERHGRAKLTEAQVILIRADRRYQHVIARDYGVTQALVGFIKRRKIWAHVP